MAWDRPLSCVGPSPRDPVIFGRVAAYGSYHGGKPPQSYHYPDRGAFVTGAPLTPWRLSGQRLSSRRTGVEGHPGAGCTPRYWMGHLRPPSL